MNATMKCIFELATLSVCYTPIIAEASIRYRIYFSGGVTKLHARYPTNPSMYIYVVVFLFTKRLNEPVNVKIG